MKCSECKFWKTFAGGSQGECRRNAPKPALAGAAAGCAVIWPLTMKADFCGEFAPAKQVGFV